jgi:diguanylate cyclase (GGDEF)-like protein
MADLIGSVADLTHLREQDALEAALAALLFEQVEAAGLLLWQVTRRDGKTWLRQSACLPLIENGVAEMPALPLDQADAGLRKCYEDKTHLRLTGKHGMFRDLFPVINGRDIVCLLEIRRATGLVPAQERLVFGLLRIYCNHLGILNYGDRDELTGLWNRRTFGDSFKRIVSPLDRGRHESPPIRIHLAVIDIDFFKRINDSFGHPYGDEVLVLLARLMSQSFRDTDLVFRFGGEEFLVMLPNTDFAAAERALERFRMEIENFHFSQVGRVTVSIGFTSLRAGDTGPNAFGRADQALYVAKHGGRNQVQCYELLIANGSLVSTAAKEQEVEMF